MLVILIEHSLFTNPDKKLVHDLCPLDVNLVVYSSKMNTTISQLVVEGKSIPFFTAIEGSVLSQQLAGYIENLASDTALEVIMLDADPALAVSLSQSNVVVRHYSDCDSFYQNERSKLAPPLPPREASSRSLQADTSSSDEPANVIASPKPKQHPLLRTDSSSQDFSIETYYNSLKQNLDFGRGESCVAEFLMPEKVAEIKTHALRLQAYEHSLGPLPSPSLLDLFYRHWEQLPGATSLMCHWLINITDEELNQSEYCSNGTRNLVKTLATIFCIYLAEEIIEQGNKDFFADNHWGKALWWAKSINKTGLSEVIKVEADRIRWYIMAAILKEAEVQASRETSISYLTTAIRNPVISSVLSGEWLDYLKSMKTEYKEIGTRSWLTSSSLPELPKKPDSVLDRAHQKNDTKTVVQLLVGMSAAELEIHCTPKSYAELLKLDITSRHALAVTILPVIENATSAEYKKASQDLTQAITNTAFTQVIGDKSALIQSKIVELDRLAYITSHREKIAGEPSFKELKQPYNNFLKSAIEELKIIIEEKLKLYEAGRLSGKSITDIEAEFSGLTTLYDRLVTIEYAPESSCVKEDIPAQFATYLDTEIKRVKAENNQGFRKHGQGRFLPWSRESKAETFTRRVVENAALINMEEQRKVPEVVWA